jgi:hypothetical protein
MRVEVQTVTTIADEHPGRVSATVCALLPTRSVWRISKVVAKNGMWPRRPAHSLRQGFAGRVYNNNDWGSNKNLKESRRHADFP